MPVTLLPDDPTPAAEVLPSEWLKEEVFQRFLGQGNVRQWIDGLLSAGEPGEALRVMTRVLPKPVALAMGCESLKTLIADTTSATSEVDRAGVALAERWLRDPSEANRREALEFAERGGFESAGAWIAAAAGWAEGSMAPSGQGFPDVSPPKHLTAEAVTAALLTRSWADPTTRSAQLHKIVVRGLQSCAGRQGTP